MATLQTWPPICIVKAIQWKEARMRTHTHNKRAEILVLKSCYLLLTFKWHDKEKKFDAFCGFYFIYSIAFSPLYTSHLYAKFTRAFKMQSLREKQTEIIDDSFCFTQIFAQTNELQTANHGSWHKALNKETSPFCFNMCSSLTWSRTHSYICTVLICSSFHF